MKNILTAAILGLTGLAGAVGAEANDGHRGYEHRRPVAHYRHEHSRRVWVAPRYETRVVGYECGRPITRVILVAPGYWSDAPACR